MYHVPIALSSVTWWVSAFFVLASTYRVSAGSGESRGGMQIRSATDLKVYQLAYALAMEIFCLSKGWPSEEKYSLTDRN